MKTLLVRFSKSISVIAFPRVMLLLPTYPLAVQVGYAVLLLLVAHRSVQEWRSPESSRADRVVAALAISGDTAGVALHADGGVHAASGHSSAERGNRASGLDLRRRFAMKIGRIEKDKPPVQVRLSVPAALHERLSEYVRYYRHVHGEDAELKAIMIEMLRSVVDADRDFLHWLKLESNKPGTTSSTGNPSHSRRVQPDSADGRGDASVKGHVQA